MQRMAAKQRATVLVVEDDGDFRQVLADILREEGCWVLEASDGEEALAAVRAVTPDLILTDLVMPRLDGWELLAILDRDPMLARIPKAVLSAALPSRRDFPHSVVEKPLNVRTLFGLLDRVDAAKRGSATA